MVMHREGNTSTASAHRSAMQCHAVVTQWHSEALPNSCIIGSVRLIRSCISQIPFFRKQEWGSWDLLQCEKEIHGMKERVAESALFVRGHHCNLQVLSAATVQCLSVE